MSGAIPPLPLRLHGAVLNYGDSGTKLRVVKFSSMQRRSVQMKALFAVK
jgi:hypothetical protein